MRSDKELKALAEIKWEGTDVIGLNMGIVNLPDSGMASVVWSRSEDGCEHVSVAPSRRYKVPTWKVIGHDLWELVERG